MANDKGRGTILILFLIALSIRIGVIIFWQFDGLYGQDSFAYFKQGIALFESVGQGQWPPFDFFWPQGYPTLIAFFIIGLGKVPLAGQLANLLCGSLLVPLTYQLSKELFPTQSEKSAILAALIICVAGQPILSSVVLMSDIPALFWATLATWLVVRFGQHYQPKWLLGAGAALAMAIVTRWVYGLITPALGLYVIFRLYYHKQAWWHPIMAVFSGLLILIPQIFISLNRPTGAFYGWLFYWNPINFFLREFQTNEGYISYQLPVGVFYTQSAGHPSFMFPIFGLIALWGLWCLWRARHWGGIILLMGWIIPVYFFLAGVPYQNLRFGLTHYLPLVILAGYGLAEIWKVVSYKGVLYQRGVQAIVVFSLLGMGLWSYWSLNRFLPVHNHSKVVAANVAQTIPAKSTILSFDITLTLQHYTQLNTLEIFFLEPKDLAELLNINPEIYLLLNVTNIEAQWSDKAPYINYQWLKTNTTLTEIAQFPPYILFKVAK